MAGHVVVVPLAGQQNANVREPEAQLLDACADQRDGLLEARIDEDVPGLGRHQKAAQVVRPDIVQVARDVVRRERLVPVAQVLGRLRHQNGRGERESKQK
jgi:hypothetical protein